MGRVRHLEGDGHEAEPVHGRADHRDIAGASVARMSEATSGSLPLRALNPHIAALMRATAQNRASDDREIRRTASVARMSEAKSGVSCRNGQIPTQSHRRRKILFHAGAGRSAISRSCRYSDFARHVDYIHYNPVKHGLVKRVCDWPHSSFQLYVRRGILTLDWAGNAGDGALNFGELR
jgi:REP element-mobilizing transposase RayT